MRWDSVIDPRLRAYRRSIISPAAARRAWSFPTPHDDAEELYFKASVVDAVLSPEQRGALLAAFDVPASILGVDPAVRSTP